MNNVFRAAAWLPALLLAACGGGSGGSATPAPSSAQAVAITEANAKPVAANGLDSAQDTSAAQGGTSLLTGVQVQDGGAAASNFAVMAAVARIALRASSTGALATGVTVSQTVACTQGGTVTVSGTIASASGLFSGDSFTLNASSCRETIGGQTLTIDGQIAFAVTGGSLTASFPAHVVLGVTAANFSVQAPGAAVVATGDARMDWTLSSATVQTLVTSGASMSSRETIGGATHTNTLRNYSESVSIDGTTTSDTMSASVETDSTRLGANGGTYAISTPSPVVWNSATGVVSAGVIRIVGANSQLLATVASDGSVSIQVDTNGDGVYDKTISSTVGELKTLL